MSTYRAGKSCWFLLLRQEVYLTDRPALRRALKRQHGEEKIQYEQQKAGSAKL
jgi:hypothetical protein